MPPSAPCVTDFVSKPSRSNNPAHTSSKRFHSSAASSSRFQQVMSIVAAGPELLEVDSQLGSTRSSDRVDGALPADLSPDFLFCRRYSSKGLALGLRLVLSFNCWIAEITAPNRNGRGNKYWPNVASTFTNGTTIALPSPCVPLGGTICIPATRCNTKYDARARRTPTHHGSFAAIAIKSSKVLCRFAIDCWVLDRKRTAGLSSLLPAANPGPPQSNEIAPAPPPDRRQSPARSPRAAAGCRSPQVHRPVARRCRG